MALDLRLRTRSVLAVPSRQGGVVCRDLDRLVPTFRVRVDLLTARMVASGHDPMVFETYRSPERAAMLARRGTGVVDSMHCYGVAADLISTSMKWSAPYAFWRDLRDHAEALGLVSGARFRARHDAPHVQCVPVLYQGVLRALARDGGHAVVEAYIANLFA